MKAVFLRGLLLLGFALLFPQRTDAAVLISAIADQRINEDTSTAAIAFSITGFSSRSPTVSGRSDNATLVPSSGIVIGGTGGSRTVTVTPAPDQTGATTITITATDTAGTDTETFLVTVLAVNDPPTITPVADRSINEDSNTGPLAFTIDDVDTPLTRLVVTTTTSNAGLVPASAVVLGGSGGARTVTVTPVANQSGTATIGLFVSDGLLTASTRFTLTVLAVNDPPTISDLRDQTIPEDSSTGPLGFTVADLETSAGQLTVTARSSNQSLLPDANLVVSTGATAPGARSLVATPAANQTGVALVTITVSDGVASSSDTFTLVVTEVNDPPTTTRIGTQSINEDSSTGPLPFSISDPETGPEKLVVTATSSNPTLVPLSGLTLAGTGADRTLTVTPARDQSGSTLITVTASDGALATGFEFTLRVAAVNDPPAISQIPDQKISENSTTGALAFTVGDVEVGPEKLTVTATSSDTALLPANGLVLGGAGANRSITVTPAAGRAGTATVTVAVSDGEATTTATFVVSVADENDPPTISAIADQTIAEEGTTGALAFTVGDPETAAANLVVTATSSNPALVPAGGVVLGGSGANRTVAVTPASNQSGSSTITVTVSDGAASASETFVVTVTAVNDPPTISAIADQTIAEEGTTGALAFTVGDAETAAAILAVTATSSNPTLVPTSGLVLGGSGANRTVTVTPASNQSGAATITVTVSDGAASAVETFVVTVTEVNDPPTISAIADQTMAEEGSTGALAFTVGDAETAAANLVVTATSSNPVLVPAGGVVLGGSGANRTVAVTPASNQSGSSTITVTVSDGAASASETFVVTVTAVNDPPTISAIADQTMAEEGSTGALAFTVGDAETAAANLAVTATSSNPTLVPTSGLVLGGSGANRTVTVTPAANQSGSSTITVTVSDGAASAVETFVVTVTEVNDPPTISRLPDQSVVAGSSTGPVAFTVDDPDGGVAGLRLSVTSSDPSIVPLSAIVLSGSGANRTITVTPVGTAGGESVITVTVSDGALAAQSGFKVTVSAAVVAPRITAEPRSLVVDEGGVAEFVVVAEGTAPLEYQWYFNNRAVAGANGNTLVLRSVGASQEGTYMVIISNRAGAASTAPVVLTVRRLDFGDSPDGSLSPAFPTLLARDGARHVLSPGFHLGAAVDSEPDAAVSVDASGDDAKGTPDDEDGIEFLSSPWVGGQTAQIRVTLASSDGGQGRLDAFADFNQDGTWSLPGERFLTSHALVPGPNTVSFTIPGDVKSGSAHVRFRLSRQGGLAPSGLASEGEVEDYVVRLGSAPPVDRFDFGDAPESSLAVLYRTRAASGGPRHRILEGFHLGKTVDAEVDGQPTADASGDDSVPAGSDDEDGVEFSGAWSPGSAVSLRITASAQGLLDAWIDFNRTGGFDAADRVLTRRPLVAGLNTLDLVVPAGAVPGATFARFRFSREGVDTPDDAGSTAPVPDGEVEDYRLVLSEPELRLDWGDAPESPAGIAGGFGYPTTLARNGARHGIQPGFFLGKLVDEEKDGQPDAEAAGDDLNPKEPDDEDGVVFSGALKAGQSGAVIVTASQTGRLDAWIDFNRNGSWADNGEQIFVSTVLVGGPNSLTFPVPPSARPGVTYARFRFSRDGKLGFDGPAPGGEVEDYRVTVAPSEPCDLGSHGTDFWLTFPGNHPATSLAPLRLTVCITGPAGTKGVVEAPGLRFSKEFVIPAAQAVEVVLPDSASLGEVVDVVQNKGVHVTATEPVAVYALNRIPYSADGFTALPTGVVGTEYLVLAYPNVHTEVSALNGTQFALVATADGTRVTVTPPRTVLGYPAGEPYEILLDQGQTYQLRDPDDAVADLSGTEIQANQPIAVFAGHQCANVSSGDRLFCDYLVEQLPPANAWGKVFHTTPLATRAGGDVFRVIAAANGTQIQINGAPAATLDRGEVHDFSLSTAGRVVASKPVYLAQFANSSDFDGVEKADPFMLSVTPVRFYASEHRVCTGPAAYGSHFLSIVAPAGAVGAVTLDGIPIPAASFAAIPGSGYSYARIPAATGSHRLTAPQPFATGVYGYATYESYAWPGTMTFGDLTPPTIVCPPDLVTNVGGVIAGTAAPRCTAVIPDLRPQVKVSDNCQIPSERAVTQAPPPGTQVGPGVHPIMLTASDSAGNEATCTVTLTVVDTGPAILSCPKDFTVLCNKGQGATVAYQVIARTACGTVAEVECSPPPGSLFLPGTTVVTCRVKDQPNQVCTFKVTVVCSPDQGGWIKGRTAPALSWGEGGILEFALSPEGPWTAVPAARSPFMPALYGDGQFFRVRPARPTATVPQPTADRLTEGPILRWIAP